MATQKLETTGAVIVHKVHGQLPNLGASGEPS
jgi:hypothetical protein